MKLILLTHAQVNEYGEIEFVEIVSVCIIEIRIICSSETLFLHIQIEGEYIETIQQEGIWAET